MPMEEITRIAPALEELRAALEAAEKSVLEAWKDHNAIGAPEPTALVAEVGRLRREIDLWTEKSLS